MDAVQEDNVETLPSYITPRGNTLTMEQGGQFSFYTIKYTDGGELPDKLKGSYTSISKACTDIENYIQTIPALRPEGEPALIKPKQYQRKKKVEDVENHQT